MRVEASPPAFDSESPGDEAAFSAATGEFIADDATLRENFSRAPFHLPKIPRRFGCRAGHFRTFAACFSWKNPGNFSIIALRSNLRPGPIGKSELQST